MYWLSRKTQTPKTKKKS